MEGRQRMLHEIAAKASGVDVVGQRLLAFVLSAFFAGLAGALYAHFLGTISVNAFYLDLTFITLAMLVVGGINSLSGAVMGVICISALIEILRQLEKGFEIGSTSIALPGGAQEIGLGVALVLVLIFRQRGITGNQEITWPLSRVMEKPVREQEIDRAQTTSPPPAKRWRNLSKLIKQGGVP
jgi:branched-chain amino acid transport system permease protein